MAGRVAGHVEDLQRADRVAVADALVDRDRPVLRPVEEDPDLERIRAERRRRLQPDGLRRPVARDDVRLPLVREHGRAGLPLQRGDPAEVGTMRVREHDPLQIGGLATELSDRIEHAAGVVLEERVHERELPVRLDQVGADAASLLGAEHVHAGCELSHARHPRPRREGVLDAPQRRRQLRIVPEQHVAHARPVDPVEPRLRVGLRVVVAGEEAVALQPPRRHQDEDAESRVAEAEALRQRLGIEPDHQVDLLDVAVDLPQLGRPRPGCPSAPRTSPPASGGRAAGTRCSAARRARGSGARRSRRGRRRCRPACAAPAGSAGSCAG